jgi:hypothetical protein
MFPRTMRLGRRRERSERDRARARRQDPHPSEIEGLRHPEDAKSGPCAVSRTKAKPKVGGFMSRFVVLFGTSHRLQGAVKGQSNVDDPTYAELVERLISEQQIDFILEEATGLGPTNAEKIALCHWGQNHYLDVDPPKSERTNYGISLETCLCFPIDPEDSQKSEDVACWDYVEEHEIREKLWLQRIVGASFTRALMICGAAHLLSFSFRLRSAAFDVKALYYMPHHKLC